MNLSEIILEITRDGSTALHEKIPIGCLVLSTSWQGNGKHDFCHIGVSAGFRCTGEMHWFLFPEPENS